MKKIVLALGGNALGNTPKEQIEAVEKTAKSIVDLSEAGNEILIVHGNGPQIGMIASAMELSHDEGEGPYVPFPELGSMSQGYIGYHLQNAITNELRSRNIDKIAASIVTTVEVDENDPAFERPTKPIGDFYTEEEMNKFKEETGYEYVEDSGRGYRRVVPSPAPQNIVESEGIRSLIESGTIVVAGGGGGIPVVNKENKFVGIDAVIDKDFTSSIMADAIDADELIVLTAVDQVYLNFGEPDQKALDKLSLDEARGYVEAGEFAEGSMKPKIEAMISFVEKKEGRRALITSLERAKDGLEGRTGTHIE